MTSSVAMRQTVKTTKLHVLSHHAGTKLRNHTLLATNNNKPTLVPFIVSSLCACMCVFVCGGGGIGVFFLFA